MSYKQLTLAAFIGLATIAVGGQEASASPIFELEAKTPKIENILQLNQKPPQALKQKPEEKRIVYTVKRGDNLTKIAKRHHTSVDRLFYKNKKISNPDVIKVGFKITIPSAKEKLKPRSVAYLTQSVAESASNRPKVLTGRNNFEWGWCTWYAQSQRPDKVFNGNAGEWMAFVNGYEPRIGAVAVNTNAAGGYGHVAIVIAIKGNQIKVRHMNWAGFGVVSEDWIDRSYWSGYIY